MAVSFPFTIPGGSSFPTGNNLSSTILQATGDPAAGVEITVVPDFRNSMQVTSDPRRVIAERLYRRLLTKRGTLSFHPEVGVDIREWVNQAQTTRSLVAMRQAIQQEALRDASALDCAVNLDFNFDARTLTATISLTLTDGSDLTFVLNVSALTVQLILQQA